MGVCVCTGQSSLSDVTAKCFGDGYAEEQLKRG
jgi:hypothetical protein